jgi:CheY-like chemotaxis protein
MHASGTSLLLMLGRHEDSLWRNSPLPSAVSYDMWKFACFIEERGRNTLALESILYISDQATSCNSVLAALEATGCEVVGTDSATQAIALLFIMHAVAVVVLHYRSRERTSFELVRSLRAIRPSVPIILLCREQIGPLPSGVDASGVYLYDAGQPREKLTSQVRRLLTAEGPCPDVDDPVHCVSA